MNSCSIFVTVCTSILGYVPVRKISNKFIRSRHLNCQFSVQCICWNNLHRSFFESPWSEQDSYALIFSMYATVAQRTREDVNYFKGKLYSFFCNYLEYHLVSWGSSLRNLFVNTFIYHYYFHLGQSVREFSKIYLVHSWILCPIYPCYRDTGILRWGDIQRVLVARKQKFQSETFSSDYIK